jgi:hypothetical protein
MTIKRELILKAVIGVMLPVWTMGVGTAMAGEPRAAGASVSRTGPAGNTATRQSNVATNGQGGYSANSTLTGAVGKTATRQQSGAYNPATKTYSRSGTTTGPNGQQSSFNTSTTATGNGLNRTATRTGPNGNSATKSTIVTTTPAPTPSN